MTSFLKIITETVLYFGRYLNICRVPDYLSGTWLSTGYLNIRRVPDYLPGTWISVGYLIIYRVPDYLPGTWISVGYLIIYRVGQPGCVVGIATRYRLDGAGIESRWEGEILHTCPDRLEGPPSLLYNGYRVFPGGKVRPGRGADHLPPSSAEFKERIELYLYSPSGLSWPVLGWTLLYFTLPDYLSDLCTLIVQLTWNSVPNIWT